MASPVDTSVKPYRDDYPGAPVLNGVAGAKVSFLDACLCTGFGSRTAVSLVVAGGVATVTLASDAKNPNLLDSVTLVSGVTGAMTDLNGEQRVTAATATTLSFATALADGTATGTIAVKTAPAGWDKVYTGTNKAVFRSADVTGTRMYLRVDDAGTTTCLVRAYEAMSDVDAGSGPFPTVADMASGAYWVKSTAANSTGNKWDLFADSRALIYCPLAGSGASGTAAGQGVFYFGDFVNFKSIDPYACAISGAASNPSSAASNGSIAHIGTTVHNLRFARSYTALGSAVQGFEYPACGAVSPTSISGDGLCGDFPPATDGVLRVSRLHFLQTAQTGSTAVLRGAAPGFLWVPHSGLAAALQRGDRVVASGDLAGRKLYVIQVGSNYAETNTAVNRALVDITGPWR